MNQSLVLLVFTAQWSAPCKDLKEKTLSTREFAEQGGALHVVEVDVDSDFSLAREYGVAGLPTALLLSPDQKLISRREGFMETASLLLWLHEGRERLKSGQWEGMVPGSKLSEFVKKAAADQLGTNDLLRLVEFLGESEPADREAAAKLLLAQREQAVPPLLDALTNSYLGIRIGASELLRQLAPDRPAFDPWQSPAELSQATAALRRWWAETGKLAATPVEQPPDPASAASIAAALENLRGPDPALRTKAMSALVAFGTGALPAVRAAIKLSDKSGDQRSMILLEDVRWAILVPDAVEQTVPGVRNSLARGTSPERLAAAARLGRSAREAIRPLAELVDDPDPLVVESAVRALSEIGGKDTIPAMAALLKAANSNLRMTAAQALGRMKNSAALAPLLPAFEDPDELVACTALSAAEEIYAERFGGSAKALPAELTKGVKKSLLDPRWRVRAAAAEVAGRLQLRDLTVELRALLEDSDGFVVKKALEALGKVAATPEPEKLQNIVQHHPALGGEVVQVLVRWGSEDAVKVVSAMYQNGNLDRRLAILGGLRAGPGRSPDTEVWQSLLRQAALETEPKLRQAAALAMTSQPAKVGAALVGPLLSDEDPETRSKAAGVVLCVISGERVFEAGSHGEEFNEFQFSERSDESSARSAKTNAAPFAPAQVLAWHTALEEKAANSSDILIACARYVTGETNAGLPRLKQALAAADKDSLAVLKKSAALAALIPRLPWPTGREIVNRLSASPALFLRMLNYAQKAGPGLNDYLLEPARFRAAVDPASAEELAVAMPSLLSGSANSFSLQSAVPALKPVLMGLLEATNATWRAAAVYCLAGKDDPTLAPVFERTALDSNPWVRVSAVLGLTRTAKDRPTLEQRLAPLLADPDKRVARKAAIGLLEPETRMAAGFDYWLNYFEFEGIHAWGTSFRTSTDQRPMTTSQASPPFLEHARRQLQESTQEEAIIPALLLAQYGDFTGLDRVLANGKGGVRLAPGLEQPVGAMVALSRDARYVPFLKQMVAGAKEQQQFSALLQALRGMTGAEARELRLEINRRMRQVSE